MLKVSGWLKPMLERIEITHVPRPEGVNVVDIPNGLNKLRSAIVSVQKELSDALQQADDFAAAWQAAQMEYQAAVAQNTEWQRNTKARLYKLQSEWITISEQLGLVVQIAHDVPPPLPQRDEMITEAIR